MTGPDVHGHREVANVHPAVALKTGALVLVALDPSGLLRGTVFRVGPQAGIALGATERLWVRSLAQVGEGVVSLEVAVAVVSGATTDHRVVGRQSILVGLHGAGGGACPASFPDHCHQAAVTGIQRQDHLRAPLRTRDTGEFHSAEVEGPEVGVLVAVAL